MMMEKMLVGTIKKRQPPHSLTQWRNTRLQAANPLPGMQCTYSELRRDALTLKELEDALLAEQGWICAYTGHRIAVTQTNGNRDVDFHIEHLTPQSYCSHGQDTDYNNLVACWPRPNVSFEPKYGAMKKGNWPPPQQQQVFISPLNPQCTHRFKFNHKGEISAAQQNDKAAQQTITRLGLDHPELTAIRKEAIQGMLNPSNNNWITKTQAQRITNKIEQDFARINNGGSDKLQPFCFVLVQVLKKRFNL